ncbi:hypothetical protein AGMMS50255_4710 [Spirochaetia bacterium]|nr:hypothetical protein AGMMS50255_4710 [Spirochaetia bacterium]
MIELEKKFPSPEMPERLAAALEIDPVELFSMPPIPGGDPPEAPNIFLPNFLDSREEVI